MPEVRGLPRGRHALMGRTPEGGGQCVDFEGRLVQFRGNRFQCGVDGIAVGSGTCMMIALVLAAR
jgi:hypothetical protein